MNDAERDRRIGECMGYLNAQFQRFVEHSRVGHGDERQAALTGMWAWAVNLEAALGLTAERAEGSGLWFFTEQAKQAAQQARNAANRADQAASRAEDAAMKASQPPKP